MIRKVLVTGSAGLVGRALVSTLASLPEAGVVAVSRGGEHPAVPGVEYRNVGNIDAQTPWESHLADVDCVIHAAARVHVMRDTAADPLVLFREVNTAGTLNLARQAAQAGVRRFIFISSVKVNGESTEKDVAFRPDDNPKPSDPYAISKYEAEQGLLALAEQCEMDVVIIRPVLVYGPGVKANFLHLMRLVYKGIPLPLGSINNARSLVGLDNLVDFIRVCIDHPAAANQIFLVSDGHDLSTAGLIQGLRAHMPTSGWLVPVPQSLLYLGATLFGRRAAAQRVLGSLRVDIAKSRELLQWSPPVSVDQGLRKTVEHFLASDQK
ncbi:UDP-glucose 4-epimerase family protein [Pseudomonas sp. NPDC088444]|uniref:UDP-glucose 4-epimerase family protein n=1 Tax=Pseudomonas sp. NPDC088444 TaxID=3364456 RepID=UPI00384D51E3